MRKLKLVMLLWVAAIAQTSAAKAQACLGLPSFAGGLVHLNASGEFADLATAYAVGIGAGRHNSLFSNLGVAQVTYEDIEAKSTLGFLEFGYQLPLGRVQICPIAGGFLGKGPDDDAIGFKATSSGATGGLAAGLALSRSFLTLIPNAALKYNYVSVKAEEAGIGSSTTTFNSSILDLGLSLVWRDRFSIQPLVHIPVSGDDDEVTYGVFASVSFGPRKR